MDTGVGEASYDPVGVEGYGGDDAVVGVYDGDAMGAEEAATAAPVCY